MAIKKEPKKPSGKKKEEKTSFYPNVKSTKKNGMGKYK
jgi:hypothetical protein